MAPFHPTALTEPKKKKKPQPKSVKKEVEINGE